MKTSKLNKYLFYILIIIVILFHYQDILNLVNNLVRKFLNFLDDGVPNNKKIIEDNRISSIPKKEIKNRIKKVENDVSIPPNKLIKLGIMYQYGLHDKPTNYQKSLEYYNKAIDSDLSDKAYYHIGKLYYEGCGDLKPDGLGAIDNLLQSLHRGNYYALLMLGDIYANGVHPEFQPNKVAAKELYELIINNADKTELVGTRLKNDAHQKYINLNKMEKDNHNERDGLAYIESFDTDADSQLPNDIVFQVRNFLPLDNPLKYQVGANYMKKDGNNGNNYNNNEDRALLKTADSYLQNGFTEITNNGFFGGENVNEQQTIFNSFNNNEVINTNNGDNNGNNNRNNNRNNTRDNDRNNFMDEIDNIIWNIDININNDSQNVHDHNLLDYAVTGINKLKNLYSGNSSNNSNLRDRIVSHLNESSLQEKQKQNVISVFNKMGTNNKKHSRLNVNELDLLGLTLNRIEDPVNTNSKNNMIENLLLNMSSGVEKNTPVCSTGRMMRVLGALDKTDSENIVELKPSWAVDEELSNIVSSIRDKNLQSSGENIQKKYDEGEEDEEIQNLINNIKNDVRNKCTGDYVNNGILSNQELELKLEHLFDNL